MLETSTQQGLGLFFGLEQVNVPLSHRGLGRGQRQQWDEPQRTP